MTRVRRFPSRLSVVALALAVSLSALSCTFFQARVGSGPEARATSEPGQVVGSRPDRAPTDMPRATVAAEPVRAAQPVDPSTARQPADSPPAGQPDGRVVFSVVEVAAKVRPAVAQILVRSGRRTVFEPIPTEGEGSGVLFDRRGYLLTNNHVVEDANEILVSLPDREKTYSARLLGRDPSTDLAVVQVDPDDLPIATLGDSDALQVGEAVVAIGNALGLEGGPTVTAGVVSALNRSIDEPNGETLYGLIQTDAAINPGNSGGPLINMGAQVIGINTAMATGSAQSPAQGIGFAISINSAKPIIEDLIAYGKVRRPYLGVVLDTVTPAVARQYRLGVDRGALVVRVERASPAARAGLEAGDVIVKIESDAIRGLADLQKALAKLKIGQKVKVEVVRKGASRSFDITLGEMPAP